MYENHLTTDVDVLAEQWIAESALDDGVGAAAGGSGGASGGSGDIFDRMEKFQALEARSTGAPHKRPRRSTAKGGGGGGGGARARLMAKVMGKK